jgi:Right handed beta helix region
MTRRLLPISVLCTLLAFGAAATGPVIGAPVKATPSTFYVAPNGRDRANGRSIKTAWRTVARVNRAKLAPGDTVLFRGRAVWNETLEPSTDGRAGAPIKFGAFGGGRAVLDGAKSSGFAGIQVEARSFLTFSDLELRAWSAEGIYVEGARDVTFTNLDIHSSHEGVHASPTQESTRITIARSSIHDLTGTSGGHAINIPFGDSHWRTVDTAIDGAPDSCVIDLGHDNLYSGLRVSHCGFGTSLNGAHGLYLRGPNLTVQDSHVWASRTSCVSVRFQGDRVVRNRLNDCEFGVSYFDYATENGVISVVRNRIWDTEIGVYFDHTKTSAFAVSANTILAGRRTGAPGMGIVTGWVRALDLTNNIVTGNSSWALEVQHTYEAYREVGNVFHAPGAQFVFGDSPPVTFAEYVALSGQGTGSSTLDPKLRKSVYPNPDLRLVALSPVRDRGTIDSAVGRLVHKCDGAVGTYCGSAPDPGAVEILDP